MRYSTVGLLIYVAMILLVIANPLLAGPALVVVVACGLWAVWWKSVQPLPPD